MAGELQAYSPTGEEFAKHETVVNGQGDYPRGEAHMNTAEGFFSQLKRSIDGVDRHVSVRHLPRYLVEFDYRYSSRKMKEPERMAQAIRRTAGKRLRYCAPANGGGEGPGPTK